jgi:hypothetical protein
MADDKKQKRVKVVSPRGIFRYPKLTEPDYGNDKFPKPDGEYSVGLILKQDSDEFRQFMSALMPHYEAAISQANEDFAKLPVGTRKKLGKVTANDLFTILYDKDSEEPTGEVVFKAAAKASGVRKKGPKAGTKWTYRPAMFDARGAYMDRIPAIWGGTVGKISVELSPYFIPGTGAAGLKMHLVGLQIIDLKTSSQRDAKSMGFGEEEGFAYDPNDVPQDDTSTDTSTNNDDDKGDF